MAEDEVGPGARRRGGALVAGLVLLAGCGGRDGSPEAGGDVPRVPAAPDEAEAMLLDAVERTMAAESVALSLTFDLGVGTAEADYDWTADGVGEIHARADRSGEAVTSDLLSDGTTAWLRSDDPDVVEHLPEGTTWIEGPLDEMSEGTTAGSAAIWASLLLLRGVESIDGGGVGSVEGTGVRIVTGEADPEAALASATAAERQLMEGALGEPPTGMRIEFALGIDRDRRIRSVDYAVTPLEDGDVTLVTRVRIEVRSFDHDVEVPEPPPADRTVSIDDIPGGMDALGGD